MADDPPGMASLIMRSIKRDWASRPRLPALGTDARSAARWPEFQRAHRLACQLCSAGATCITHACLSYLLQFGHHPLDFFPSEEPPVIPPQSPPRKRVVYNLEPAEATFVHQKHEDWLREHVLAPPRRPSAAEGHPPWHSPTFVVTKAAIRAGRELEAQRFLLRHPAAARATAYGDTNTLPADLFERKNRAVYDMTALNSLCPKLSFAYPSIVDALAAVRPGVFLAALDVREGYTTLRLAPGASAYFRCTADDGCDVEHERLSFGYTASPAIFCMVSGELGRLVQLGLPDGSRVVVYVDDLLLVINAHDAAEANRHLDEALALLQHLGFEVHPRKVQRASTSVTYLGFQLTACHDGVRLAVPTAKATLYCAGARALLAQLAENDGRAPKFLVASTLGRAAHILPVFPNGKARIAPLWSLLREKQWRDARRSDTVSVPPLAAGAVSWLLRVLASGASRLFSHLPVDVVEEWECATDASGVGGLGGFGKAAGQCGRASPTKRFCFSGFTRRSIRHAGNASSTYLELLAVEWALEEVAARRTKRPGLVVTRLFSDSQACLALLRRGFSSASAGVNAAVLRVRELSESAHLLIVPCWIPREHNWLADGLSHPELPAVQVHASSIVATSRGSVANLLTPARSSQG